MLRRIAGSGWGSASSYYTLFSRAFRREQEAVAAGLALFHSPESLLNLHSLRSFNQPKLVAN